MRTIDIFQVAKVCHEANRSYCQTIGDQSQPSWEDAPAWQQTSAVNGVNFHLENLKKGHNPDSSASHNAWLAEKQKEGWKYGAVKDAAKKEHPCFLPYEQLPFEQRLKDYIFGAIVLAFFVSSKAENNPIPSANEFDDRVRNASVSSPMSNQK